MRAAAAGVRETTVLRGAQYVHVDRHARSVREAPGAPRSDPGDRLLRGRRQPRKALCRRLGARHIRVLLFKQLVSSHHAVELTLSVN